MLYRAGPDEYRDVVAFCGPNNGCYFVGTGPFDKIVERWPQLFARNSNGFLGHAWLRSGTDIVDFSVPKWRTYADMAEDGMGAIQWQVEPPDFYWQDQNSLTAGFRAKASPPIGEAWYHEGVCTASDEDRREVSRQFQKMQVDMLEHVRDVGLLQVVANNLRARGLCGK